MQPAIIFDEAYLKITNTSTSAFQSKNISEYTFNTTFALQDCLYQIHGYRGYREKDILNIIPYFYSILRIFYCWV